MHVDVSCSSKKGQLGDQTIIINKGFSQSHPLVVSLSWKKKRKILKEERKS